MKYQWTMIRTITLILLLGQPNLVQGQAEDCSLDLDVLFAMREIKTFKACIKKSHNLNERVIERKPDKVTILMEVLASGDVEDTLSLVQLLLKAGADPNIKSQNGKTALHFAVRHLDLECIKALIAAKADVNARDNEGKTPLRLMEERKKKFLGEPVTSPDEIAERSKTLDHYNTVIETFKKKGAK